jgi:cbb3-type cytochrome oxidase subunit 3
MTWPEVVSKLIDAIVFIAFILVFLVVIRSAWQENIMRK